MCIRAMHNSHWAWGFGCLKLYKPENSCFSSLYVQSPNVSKLEKYTSFVV